MDINVTVTVELGPNTFALISGIMQRTVVPQETKTEAAPTAQADKTEKAPAKGGGAGKPPKEEPIKEEHVKEVRTFADLTEEEQIEAIKAEVTKHTKRGKSGDIKALLTFVGAERVSNLKGYDIENFMALVQRYGKGEDIDILTSLD